MCVWGGEQLQSTEYSEALRHLMSDCRFHCHNCCYNAPLATVVFTVLFCLHVTLVPVIEQQLIDTSKPASAAARLHHHTGLEFIHGIIIWLCLLALYLLITQLAKMKVHQLTDISPTSRTNKRQIPA